MRPLLSAIFILLFFTGAAQFQGLLINEFSQGDAGSKEYIELLVAGKRTCSDSTADIRGWIVDDQNGWYGTTSITKGHYRFKNVANWAAVPIGSIILLYNSAANEKNNSITLADDVTDANNDLTYIVPINSSAYIEEADNEPLTTTGPLYVYPAAGSSAGYTNSSNLWVQHIALNNGSDVICTVSPQDRSNHYFAIGYGFPIAAGFKSSTVSIAAVNGGSSCYLTNAGYATAGNWAIAPVPLNETPGSSNGGANTTWIEAMRITPKALATYTTACSNGAYTFFGQTFFTTGAYTVLTTNATGCVDTNRLYVVVKKTQVADTTGCDSLIYKGVKYTSNTTIIDNISSIIINCDSVVKTLRITIKKSSSSLTKACAGIGQTYMFNNLSLTSSDTYAVTLTNAQGCDSIANLYLVKTVVDSATHTGCDSVFFRNKWYYNAAVVKDTVKSIVTICDSIIHVHTIVINKSKSSNVTACVPAGGSYNFFGQMLTASGNYVHTLSTSLGCDSIIRLRLIIAQLQTQDQKGCDSVVYNGKTYYASTVVADTLHSQPGCDSIIHQINIIITAVPQTTVNACIGAGQSYPFNGQTLTTSGSYTTTFPRAGLCDSLVHLKLSVAQLQSTTYQGCSHYTYNGIDYTSSIVLRDTLKNSIGCDSILRTTNIIITPRIQSHITACIKQGQSYAFNGQSLTAGGYFTAQLTAQGGCDSVVNLYLVVATTQLQNLVGCDSVQLNGSTYYNSTQVTDTTRSLVSGCDSMYKVFAITVKKTLQTNVSICLPQGQTYNLNGQSLTASGQYTTVFTRPGNCDSIVHLTLVIPVTQLQTLTGCDSVLYKGIVYHASAIAKDTIKSTNNCDSIYHLVTIAVTASPKTFTTACIAQGQTYNFNGQILTTTGHYQTVYTTSHCDSTVNLYLVAAKKDTLQLQGCNSVTYNGIMYTTSTSLSDTIHSSIGCDSVVRTINIAVSPSKNTYVTACIKQGQRYIFNGQNLTVTGNYIANLATPAGCDSIVHLYLLVSRAQLQTVKGCDSVFFNNNIYYTSTQITDTLKSSITACDSLYRITNIVVQNSTTTNTQLCLGLGQTYNFNGQPLTASGTYTTTYHRAGACDSTVHLTLIIPVAQSQMLTGCDSVKYKGITYYTSTVVQDTVKSSSACDSIYNITQINIRPSQTFTTACIQQGQVYNFNGQSLLATGNYVTAFPRPGLCDSIVHLYLVVSEIHTQTVTGCGVVIYNGSSYYASTSVSDTLRGTITSCDSIINTTVIQVTPKPVILTSGNITICKGDTAQLKASSLNTTVNWTGFGATDTIVVAPPFTTTYTATATDNNGCSNTASVVVSVEDFMLTITTATNPVLMGATITVQTNANFPYTIYEWQPSTFFPHQTEKSQRFIADSSLQIFIVARTTAGCKDTAYLSLVVTPLDDIYIPSGFTPNGDGRNDLVVVTGAFKEIDFKIFNRWGQLIFYTTDKYKGWDGKMSGVLQPSGTYVYVVKAKKSSGQVIEKRGTVTLIR